MLRAESHTSCAHVGKQPTNNDTSRRPTHRGALLSLLLMAASVAAACSGSDAEPSPPDEGDAREASFAIKGTTTPKPVGLAIEIENGVGVPLDLRAGQTFYIDQIDVRASTFAGVDEDVAGLDASGDFANLPWHGVAREEEAVQILPSTAGQFTRVRFYRGAAWMRNSSSFTITQVDEHGLPTAPPTLVHVGADGQRLPNEDFFVRRFRALQWTYDCPLPDDCTGATQFEEEALVELRHATDKKPLFRIQPQTTALRVGWSMKPGAAYTVPITQSTSLPFEYGLSVELQPLTPTGPSGYYLPGQDVSFRVSYLDGAGNRLHPEGSLPSYFDVLLGVDPSGLQYFRGFLEPSVLFWRRMHRERMPMVEILGPAQNIQPIHSVLPLDSMFVQDVQEVGLPERDGVFMAWKIIPATDVTFVGGLDPDHALWALPGSDVVTFHLPDNAEAGTYRVTAKARRTYHGEDIGFTRTIEIPVGTTTHTTATLDTGKCNACHTGPSSLSRVLHANADRATCNGCHAPLEVEPETAVPVRIHYIHSRSNRVDAKVEDCSLCHLSSESIQRTSKSACLSCHKSYPADHVASFGPIVSPFTGGLSDSFAQCSTTCHTTHPESGL